MKALKWLFSGEVIFAGFLFASVFKGIFESSPIDLTLMFMFLSILIALKRLIVDPSLFKRTITPMVIFFILALFVFSSLIYSPSVVYGTDKALRFVTVTTWSFLGVMILIKNINSLQRFLKGLLFYGILTSLYIFFDYFNSGVGYSYYRFGIGGDSNVLGLGRLAGITGIIIVSLYFYGKRCIKERFIAFVGFCLTTFVLLITGSRMPFIAFVFSLIIFIPLSLSFEKRDILISRKILPFISLACLGVIALIPLYFKGFFQSMFLRLSNLFEQFGGGSSVIGRVERFIVSWNMWLDSPIIGKGIGSFPIYFDGVDTRNYSHNIFLEAMSELGIIGLTMLLLLILCAVLTIIKYRKTLNVYQISVATIFLFLFLNSNTTGDFNDNRLLFSFMALSLMLPIYIYKPKEI